MTECLGYLAQVFRFLDQSFESRELTSRPAALLSRAPELAVGHTG
jgi:hypothetical protein